MRWSSARPPTGPSWSGATARRCGGRVRGPIRPLLLPLPPPAPPALAELRAMDPPLHSLRRQRNQGETGCIPSSSAMTPAIGPRRSAIEGSASCTPTTPHPLPSRPRPAPLAGPRGRYKATWSTSGSSTMAPANGLSTTLHLEQDGGWPSAYSINGTTPHCPHPGPALLPGYDGRPSPTSHCWLRTCWPTGSWSRLGS